jgi:hypothetical protein
VNQRARLVTVALAVLGLTWAVAPQAALPLYDGIGFPDEPYRFVQRPAGAQETEAPTDARGTAPVHAGSVGSLVAASAEVAPQISLYIPKGRLAVPAGTTEVTLTGTPAPPLPTGRGQYLWSNVYDVRATPGVRFNTGSQQATITLRTATAQRPQPHIAYFASGQWHLLPTFAQGRDIYIAELTTFGQFAVIGGDPLTVAKISTGAGKSGGGGGSVGLIVGIAALVVVVVLFVLGRQRRAKVRAEAGHGGTDAAGADDP